MFSYKKIIFIIVLFFLVFGSLALVAKAENPAPAASGIPACDPAWYKDIIDAAGDSGKGFFNKVSQKCWACGDCQLCDFLALADNIAKFLLGLIGAVAFFMFVYGGFSFIFSSGSSEKVESSKKILINAVIGILIVLLSWELVNLVIGLLAGQSVGEAANIFGNPWFDVCKTKK